MINPTTYCEMCGKNGTCKALTCDCSGVNIACKFYATDRKSAREATYKRLSGLSFERQLAIANKYYGGRFIWKEA